MDIIKNVFLDTSVIKNILYEENDYCERFTEIKKKSKVKFRIAETAYAEILADLLESSITIEQWLKKKDEIYSFLDENCPMQEQGYNLSVDMDTFLEKKERNTLFSKKYWKTCWDAIYKIKKIEDITKTIIFHHNHKPCNIKVKEDLIAKAFDESRDEWYQYFTDVKELVNPETKIEEIREIFCEEFGKRYNIEKMKDFVYALAKYTYLHVEDKKFNPYSKKRRNDCIDFSFLQLLAKPAIFCTSDEKFQKFTQQAELPNKSNVMSPQQVFEYYS